MRQSANGSPPLILVANDQEWSARSLETVLGPAGYATMRAYTGGQVLDLVTTVAIDALIIDHSLPDMSGLEVVRQLRQHPAFHGSIPILMLTAGTPSRAVRLAAYEAGAWELLAEPYDVEALCLKLGLFVGARRDVMRSEDAGMLDRVTGLYNSRGLARRVREIGADASRLAQPLTCIALTLTPASEGSREHIAEAQAAALALLSETCRTTARISDTIGRLGRTEVVIVCPHTDSDGAADVLLRITKNLEGAAVQVNGERMALRLSSGVTTVADFSRSTSDAGALVLHAADRLRSARQRHRDAPVPLPAYSVLAPDPTRPTSGTLSGDE
jgi:diguanylate cyclase (GGDEF)-like protein